MYVFNFFVVFEWILINSGLLLRFDFKYSLKGFLICFCFYFEQIGIIVDKLKMFFLFVVRKDYIRIFLECNVIEVLILKKI